MTHGFVAGPVVLCAIDLTVVQGGIHLAVHYLYRLCAKVGDHFAHHVRFLHADGQALQIRKACHLLPGVDAAHTGIEPGKAGQLQRLQRGEELVADGPIQHAPHLVSVGVKVRQLQYAQRRFILSQLAEGHAREVNAAELHLLDHALLRAQFSPAVHQHFHAAIGALGHKIRKGQRRLRSRIILRLVLRIAQDQFRPLLLLHRLMAAARHRQCQHGCAKQGGQHLAAGHRRASRAALAASLRYWVGVMPVRFLKVRAK